MYYLVSKYIVNNNYCYYTGNRFSLFQKDVMLFKTLTELLDIVDVKYIYEDKYVVMYMDSAEEPFSNTAKIGKMKTLYRKQKVDKILILK